MAAPASPPDAPTKRPGLAVLGGSFNPPHATHRRLVEAALAGLPVDRVLVIPAGDHPHKRNTDMAPAEDRLAMCRLAFADLPRVTVDDRELRRTGPSFTVDTLASLGREHPGRRIFFLIGSDNLPLLPTWREPERLLTLCEVVTYPRLGHPLDDAAFAALPLPAELQKRLRDHALDVPADAIAASELRRRWRAGEHDLAELHPEVRAYIRAHHLYR